MGSAAPDYDSVRYAHPLEAVRFDASAVAEHDAVTERAKGRNPLAVAVLVLAGLFTGLTLIAPKLWMVQTLGWN